MLVRRVELGGSLEVEVLNALGLTTERANVPELAARVDIAVGGETSTVWLSESFIPNEGNAWQLTVDCAQHFYEGVLTGRHGEAPLARSVFGDMDPASPTEFAVLVELLGRRTAELHAALFEATEASDAPPKPFNALSSRAFYQSVRNLSAQALDALRAAALPAETQALAQELLAQKGALRRLIDRALAHPLVGLRMRVHGDYHLGQVLYTGNDFYIIDFEGEPARAPAQRRRLRSPLADVAGMIRSLHYAAFGVLSMPLAGAQIRPEDREQLRPWAQYFFEACSRALLAGYFAAAAGSKFVSMSADERRVLLEVHWVEKALYELLYELNNRPPWAELPLRGLLSLVAPAR